MANIAIFKPGQTPQYLTSVNEGPYVVDPNVPKNEVEPNDADVLINPDVSAVAAVPLKYWKRVGDLIQEMTAGEKTTLDAAEAAAALTARRTTASNVSNNSTADGIQMRAIVSILLDELNTLRAWTVSFKAEVAAATTLADLKSRVATLSTLNNRTLTQAKTAYQNKINDGSAD